MRFVSHDQLTHYGITLSKAHLWRLERAGKFPKRVHPTAQSIAWIEQEILEYMQERITRRNEAK